MKNKGNIKDGTIVWVKGTISKGRVIINTNSEDYEMVLDDTIKCLF